MSTLTCRVCGGSFTRPGSRGRKPTYCSPACRSASRCKGGHLFRPQRNDLVSHISYANCSWCRKLFVRRTRNPAVNVSCRDTECQRLQRNRQMCEWFQKYRAENGEAYTNRYLDKRKAWMKQRINQKLSLPYDEFTDDEIFERDKWICQICFEPVDSDLKWPDPMSKSLDHKVPLSKGGHHLRSNCRLAHVTCNVRRGNKMEVDDGRSGTAA